VLGDIESLREIWEDAAVFVDPNDREALKTELLRLIKDERYRHTMSFRARERALHFTRELMGRKYLAAYSQLLKQPRSLHRQESFAQCA
jgi:glycosyltransferase involved in cell wall biosynthesis